MSQNSINDIVNLFEINSSEDDKQMDNLNGESVVKMEESKDYFSQSFEDKVGEIKDKLIENKDNVKSIKEQPKNESILEEKKLEKSEISEKNEPEKSDKVSENYHHSAE